MQEAKQVMLIILEPENRATSVVIWLHGLGADGNDFVDLVPNLNLPKNHGVRFIFPHAPVQAVTINGGMKMRSWYDIRTTNFMNDIDVVGIKNSCYQIQELIKEQLVQGISANKIVLAGFSQGGLIALHAGLSFEHKLAGIVTLSTYCPLSEQFCLHKGLNILMVHGKADPVIPISVAQASHSALSQKGYAVQWLEYPMEHQVCIEEVGEISTWLQVQLVL